MKRHPLLDAVINQQNGPQTPADKHVNAPSNREPSTADAVADGTLDEHVRAGRWGHESDPIGNPATKAAGPSVSRAHRK